MVIDYYVAHYNIRSMTVNLSTSPDSEVMLGGV